MPVALSPDAILLRSAYIEEQNALYCSKDTMGAKMGVTGTPVAVRSAELNWEV